MTLAQICDVLQQARDVGSVKMIYFEGGEPFLFYPILLEGLRAAAAMGFQIGIVSNAYWATSVEDAAHWLRPIADLGIDVLSLSSDLYHGEAMMTPAARNGVQAARQLGLPEGVLSVEVPEGCAAYEGATKGQPISGGAVRFRGRAVAKLTEGVPRRPWHKFTECPDEDFHEPGRVHVDAYPYVHFCQGLLLGNLWQRPLREILGSYEPGTHPIIGPLVESGPARLVEHYGLPYEEAYIDACHLCYLARDALRPRFPELLGPANVYGEL